MARIFLGQLAIKYMFNFPLHPKSVCALPGENRTNGIFLFSPNAVLLLNLNNIQKLQTHILLTFLTLWLTFHPTVLLYNCAQQNFLNCRHIVQTQVWRCFPHSLTAVSIMFCFRPTQSSPVTSWIHKHSWTSSLLYDDQTL